MKKYFLAIILLFLSLSIEAQGPLLLEEGMAYKMLCKSETLKYNDYWLDYLGKKYYGTSYETVKKNKDEFQINKYKSELLERYQKAEKSVKIGVEYFVTELINDYSYDFATNSVKIEFKGQNEKKELDCYTEGFLHSDLSNSNPTLSISNWNNIPELIEMPSDKAEVSFNNRKGANRAPFTIRFFFKFWQCGSKFPSQYVNGGIEYAVEVTKVVLIDEMTNYTKEVIVKSGDKPIQKKEAKESTNSSEQNNNSEVNVTETVRDITEDDENNLTADQINLLNSINEKYNYTSQVVKYKLKDFKGKFLSRDCKKGYFEFNNVDSLNYQIKTTRRNCINLFGSEKLTYNFYEGTLYYELSNYTKNDIKIINVFVVYFNNAGNLIVNNYGTSENGTITNTEKIYIKEK